MTDHVSKLREACKGGQTPRILAEHEAQRERNRARWPDLAKFIDELRSAGLDEVVVGNYIHWPSVDPDGDTG